jgi:hypothetical protein
MRECGLPTTDGGLRLAGPWRRADIPDCALRNGYFMT